MTKIKLCGLTRPQDIHAVNILQPEYVGFVFAPGSKRYVSAQRAQALKSCLSPKIQAVGVFVDESLEQVAELLNSGIIDLAQLHGNENWQYIQHLRTLTQKPIIQAFRITTHHDVIQAEQSMAHHILLDAGAGTGTAFDWNLLRQIQRPYFLAGGLTADNVGGAVELLRPYVVDVSSGIETDGHKDPQKMAAFIAAVRKEARK